jgi:dolichyl-phosphate-mannose-protein mannosyltransferase
MIAKNDLITVAVLSIVFFFTATWALGNPSVPQSAWKSEGGATFYVDFGSVNNVSKVYLLLKQGSIIVDVYTGRPGNWSQKTTASFGDYYHWEEIQIDTQTEFVKFAFQISDGEIAEITASNGEGQRIAIETVTSESIQDTNLTRLIDEQQIAECPPTYKSGTYFDEIYYVRTAEDYLNLRQPYEWTHPPLGKLIIAAGIRLLGENPFSWRIAGVIFATLMIPAMFLFGKKMFRTWIGGVAPAFLLMLDFMHFTMARIATIDTFVVFFSILSQLFFFIYVKNVLAQGWKTSTRPLFLAVLFFALGFSTKWYVLFGFVGQMLILLVLRLRELSSFKGPAEKARAFFRRPFRNLLIFVAIAAVIYLLTFVPYMIIGHTLLDVYQAQWSMFNYHSGLTATHPFSSPWWTWPLIIRPVWFYVSELPGGIVSTIAAMGNPAVWWIGFVSIIFTVEEAVRARDRVCLFLSVLFFSQWLPYALISRTLFLYHFYFDIPIMILATSYFINNLWRTRRGKVTVLVYLSIVVAMFVLFYPVISGTPIPFYWRNNLRWLRSWVF